MLNVGLFFLLFVKNHLESVTWQSAAIMSFNYNISGRKDDVSIRLRAQ